MPKERPRTSFFWLEAGTFHNAQYCQRSLDVAASDICFEKRLVLRKLELRFPIAENAEDIRRQVCITVSGGGYKDVEADTGWRVQVRRFDLFLPGVEGGFVL